MSSLTQQLEELKKQQQELEERIQKEKENKQQLEYESSIERLEASIERLEGLVQPLTDALDTIDPITLMSPYWQHKGSVFGPTSLLRDPDIIDIIRFKLADKNSEKYNVDLKNHLRLDYNKLPSVETAKTILKLFGPYFNGWMVVVDAYAGMPGAFIFHPSELTYMKKSIFDYGGSIYHNDDEDYTNYALHIIFKSHSGTCDVIKQLIEITAMMDIRKYTPTKEFTMNEKKYKLMQELIIDSGGKYIKQRNRKSKTTFIIQIDNII